MQLFKYVFLNLIPEVIVHSQSQDEEQVRDHYDREYRDRLMHFMESLLILAATLGGDDFYGWFLGPRM